MKEHLLTQFSVFKHEERTCDKFVSDVVGVRIDQTNQMSKR